MNYTYEIIIRKTVICKAGATVISMLDARADNTKPLDIHVALGDKTNTGKFGVYLDSVDNANMIGMLESITAKDTPFEMEDDDIKQIIGIGNYTIKIMDHEGNMIKGELVVDVDAKHETANDDTADQLKELITEKTAAGIMEEAEIQKRIDYMKENHVDPFLMERVIKGYRKYNRSPRQPSCLYADPYYRDGQESIISEGLRAAVSRQAIVCEGEKSVGKNVYVETLAWLLGMPMYLITFSRAMSPSQIFGEKTTDNSASEALNSKEAMDMAASKLMVMSGEGTPEDLQEAARFEVLKARSSSVNIIMDQSELYDALSDGGMLIFNEMNYADANMMASIANQMLDGTGFLNMPGRGEVHINPDTVLFGTQNADYAGTEMQNEATMSRFGCIQFPQPDTIKGQLLAAVKTQLVKSGWMKPEENFSKTEMKWFKEADAFYGQCRKAIVNSGDLTNACLNIRGFVRAITAVAESHGYAKLKRQIEIHVVNTCPVDDRMALMATLESMVTT